MQKWAGLPAGVPLFESIIVVENYPLDAALLDRGGNLLKIREAQVIEHSNFPLTLVVYPHSDMLLRIIYDRGRFDPDAVVRMLTHYVTLLKHMSENQQGLLADMKMTFSPEVDCLVSAFSGDLAGRA
jgi:non-ribosomal peptide synthetase component F